MRKVRLAYLVSHPIQYQAPLLRRIAEEPGIDLTVFFCSDFSVREFNDLEFGGSINWDVPLLSGYRYDVLPAVGRTDRVSFWRPLNYGLIKRLKTGRFDVLWIHGYARPFYWVAVMIAKLLRMKVMIRTDATLISAQRSPTKRVAKRVFFLGLKSLCDRFLAIGSLNREYYVEQGVEDKSVVLVPYAVDNSFFQAKATESTATREELRASLGLDKARPVILYASKMIKRKRALDLLESYSRLSPDGKSEPYPYLLFIGDGEERETLEKQASQLGWSSIKFLGFKNQTELPRYYDLCDVFVLPSVYEPWGLVINEVMNAGRAVIVSDQVGCWPDLVKGGENGYVIEAGNIDDLCGRLRQVLADPERCHAMGLRSLEIINEWGFEEDVAGLKAALELIDSKENGL